MSPLTDGGSPGGSPDAPVSASDAEARRLAALQRYTVLDTDPEESFDRIVRLAHAVTGADFVLLGFFDATRQWFKSRRGIDPVQAPRTALAAERLIDTQEPVLVDDAAADPALAGTPLVAGPPHIRRLVSVPLVTADGFVVGGLTVAEPRPGPIDAVALEALRDLARVVMDELHLRQIATIDELTGVLTRRAFDEALEREGARASRSLRGYALIVLDIDRFKAINDTLGHPAGDLVLSQLSRLCRQRLRSSDMMGRLGGEEFAILLPETGLKIAARVAERLRALIAEWPFQAGGAPRPVTASFGVASSPDGMEAPEQLIARADEALYAAKRQGRNRVVAAEDDPGEAPHGGAHGGPQSSA